jgi:multidrug efflux pump subunit AcrA (membrane-fusion protein)
MVALRLALVLGAVAAVAAGADHAIRAARSASGPARFACPMHPEIRSPVAGSCPLCAMALTPIDPATAHEDGLSARDAFAGADEANRLRYSTDRAKYRVLHQGVDAPAWIDADGRAVATIYRTDAPSVSAGTAALFRPSDGGEPWEAVVDDTPPEAWDPATARIRLSLRRATERVARVSTVGRVVFPDRDARVLVVPAGAVLASTEGPYVLAFDAAATRYQRRPVTVGRSFAGFVAIAEGLAPGDAVVTINAFFLDAERRVHAGEGL